MENTTDKPSINSVLKESLGNIQNIAGPDAAETPRQDNLVVVDYKMVTFSLAGKDMLLTL